MSKSPATTKGEEKLPPIHPGRILFEDMQDEEIGINLDPAVSRNAGLWMILVCIRAWL